MRTKNIHFTKRAYLNLYAWLYATTRRTMRIKYGMMAVPNTTYDRMDTHANIRKQSEWGRKHVRDGGRRVAGGSGESKMSTVYISSSTLPEPYNVERDVQQQFEDSTKAILLVDCCTVCRSIFSVREEQQQRRNIHLRGGNSTPVFVTPK